MNEKPIAWPDEILRVRPAYFRIFASKIHWAHVLQIVVETVSSQTGIEKLLLHFNLRNIRLKSNRISILQCYFSDVLDGCSPESIRHDCAFLTGLYDPEFNREAWVFCVHHE